MARNRTDWTRDEKASEIIAIARKLFLETRSSSWFQATRERREGRIRAGGVARDVRFNDADVELNDAIDAAYRTKYQGYAAR